MQNTMSTTDLQAQVKRLDAKVDDLERELSYPLDDESTGLRLERDLADTKTYRARVQAQLNQQTARDQAERERNERERDDARIIELRELFTQGVDDLALRIDAKARELETSGFAAEVQETRQGLEAMSTEHRALLRKTMGEEPDVLQTLGFWRSLVPVFEHKLEHDFSAAYPGVSAALFRLIGGDVLWMQADQMNRMSALHRSMTAETGNKPAVSDPEPTERSYGTAAQRAGRDRANLRASREQG